MSDIKKRVATFEISGKYSEGIDVSKTGFNVSRADVVPDKITEATILLEIDYREKRFSILSTKTNQEFGFIGGFGKKFAEWSAVGCAIQKACEFAKKELADGTKEG